MKNKFVLQKSFGTKIVASALSAAMTISLLPVSVMAAETDFVASTGDDADTDSGGVTPGWEIIPSDEDTSVSGDTEVSETSETEESTPVIEKAVTKFKDQKYSLTKAPETADEITDNLDSTVAVKLDDGSKETFEISSWNGEYSAEPGEYVLTPELDIDEDVYELSSGFEMPTVVVTVNEAKEISLSAKESGTTITVDTMEGIVPDGTELTVSELSKGDAADYIDAINASLPNGQAVNSYKAYDVTLVDEDDNELEPDGEVSVTFKNIKGLESDSIKVFHFKNNDVDQMEVLESSTSDNAVICTTDSFSDIVLAEVGDKSGGFTVINTITEITSAPEDAEYYLPNALDYDDMTGKFGNTLKGKTTDDTEVTFEVTWACDNYDKTKTGTYTFKCTVKNPDKYITTGVTLPTVSVTIKKPVISSITDTFETYNVLKGSQEKSDIIRTLGTTLSAKTDKDEDITLPVEWTCDNYNKDAEGTYTFTCSIPSAKASLYDVSKVTLPSTTIKVTAENVEAGLIRSISSTWGEDNQALPSVRDAIGSLANLDSLADIKAVAVTVNNPKGTIGTDYVDIGVKPYSYSKTCSTISWKKSGDFTGRDYHDGSWHTYHGYYYHGTCSGCDETLYGKDNIIDNGYNAGFHGASSHTRTATYTGISHVYAWFDSSTKTLYIQNNDDFGKKPILPSDISNMFNGFTGLVSLDLEAFDCSKVTSNANVVGGCTSLESITLGADWKFTNVKNSGLQSAKYPTGEKGYWHKDDEVSFFNEATGKLETGDGQLETTLGYIDIYTMACYTDYDLACATLGFAKSGEEGYEMDHSAWEAAQGVGTNNMSESYMTSISGFESNYNNAAATWHGTWLTGLGTAHRYWKTEGVANVNNMIEIHNPSDKFTTYCWAQHRGPNSGWYDRLEVTTEKQMITNLEVYHQNYRPLPAEKNSDAPMLRSFITIMYYGDITSDHINWKGLSAQQRAYATMSAVQYCSDHANYSYGNPNGVVDQILNKSYDSIPNADKIHFYIYLSTHEGGGQQQMGAESVTLESYGGVAIKKEDSYGNPLQGAQFTVYTDENCSNILTLGNGKQCVLTTDSSGIAEACKMDKGNGIPVGTYYIKETKTPNDAYTLSTDVFKFEVRKDHVTSAGYRNGSTSRETMIVYNESSILVKYGDVVVTKTSTTSPDKKLSGAVYELYAAEDLKANEKAAPYTPRTIVKKDTLVTTVTTDKDGNGSAHVPIGKYYVKEKTAPGGYLIDVGEYETTSVEGTTTTKVVADPPKEGTFTVTAKKVIPGGYKMTAGQFTFKLYMLTGSLGSDGTPALQDLGVSAKNAADGTITFPEFTVNAENKITYKNDNGETKSVVSSYSGEIQFAIKEVIPANEKTISNQDQSNDSGNGRYTYDDTIIYVVGAVIDTEGKDTLDVSLEYEYGMGDFTYHMESGTSVDAATIVNEIKSHLEADEVKAYHMDLTLSGIVASEKNNVRVKNNGNGSWTVSMADGYTGESAILLRYLDDNGNEYDVPVMVMAKEGKSEAIICNVFNTPFPIPAPTKEVSGGNIIEEKIHNEVKALTGYQYDIIQEIPKQTKANFFKSFVMKDTLPAGVYVNEESVKIYKDGADITSNWKIRVTHSSADTKEEQQYTVTATYTGNLDDASVYGATYDFRLNVTHGQKVASKTSYYNHAEIYITYKDIESRYALDADGNVRFDDNGNMTYDAENEYDNTSNDKGVNKPAGNYPDGTALQNRENDKFESATTSDALKAVYHRTTNEVQTDVYAHYPEEEDPWGQSTWSIRKYVFNTDGKDIDKEDVHAGDELTYVVYVRNEQESTNASVTVTDTLPSSVAFKDADNGGKCDENGTVTWTNLDLDAGTTLKLTVHVTVNDVTRASDIDNKATATITPDEPTDGTSNLERVSETKSSNTVHNYVPGIVKVVTDEKGNNINGLFVNNGDTLYYHVFVINTDTAGTDPYRNGVHTFDTSDVIPENSVLIGKAAEGRIVTQCPEPGVLTLSMEGSNKVAACDEAESVSWSEEFKPGEIKEYCFNVKAVGDGIDVLNQAETVKKADETKYNVYTEVVNGTITPDIHEIVPGTSAGVQYQPKEGYHLVAVEIDGRLVDINDFPSDYTFEGIEEDHYVKVVYAPDANKDKTYTIVTEVVGGTIDNSIYNIAPGTDEKISYYPYPGYHLVSIKVDGKDVGLETFEKQYPFDDVQADHAIIVVYEPDVDPAKYNKEDHAYKSNEVVNSTPLSVKKVMTLDGEDIDKQFIMVGDTYYYTISVFNNAFGTKKYTITDVVPDNITVTGIDDGSDIKSRTGAAEGEIIKTAGEPVAESSAVATEVGTHSYKDRTITWVTELKPNEIKSFTFTFIPDTKEDEFVNDAHVKIDQWATDPITNEPIPSAPDIPKEVDTNEVINWTPADPVKTVTRKTPTGDGKYEIQDMDTALVWGENADTLNYRISFSNNSSLKKTFKVTDKLDDDITFVKASDNGTYDESTRTITWLIDMEPKSEAHVTFDAKVSVGNNIASANNYATLIIEKAYPDSNETDTDIDETPTKSVYDSAGNDIDQYLVNKNDELTYVIRVKNPDELTKRFTVKDIVPENTELLSVEKGVFEETEWSKGQKTKSQSTFNISVAPGSTKTLEKAQLDTLVSDLSMTLVSFENGKAVMTASTEETEDMIAKIYESLGEGYKVTGSLDSIGKNVSAATSDMISTVLVNGKDMTEGTAHSYNVTAAYTAVAGENIPAGKYVLTTNGKAGYVIITDTDGEETVYSVGKPVDDDFGRTFEDASPFGDKQTATLKKGYTITTDSRNGLTVYLVASDLYNSAENYGGTTDTGESVDAIAAEGSEIVWTCDIPSGESYMFSFTVRTLKKDTYIPNEATVTVDKSSIKTNIVENWIPDDPMKAVVENNEDINKKVFFRPDEEHYTYEIQVKNPAGIKKTFTATDVLDEDLVFVSASDKGTLGDNNTVTWEVEVGAGETKTVTVEVYISSSTSKSKIRNSATVGADEFHYTTNTVITYVTDPPVKQVLSGTKDLHKGLVFTGDEYTYKITWQNPTDETRSFTVTDKVPDEVSFVSADSNGTEADGIVTWKNVEVKAGGTGTVSFVVKVKKDHEREHIYNTANVQYSDNPKLYNHDTNEVKVTVGKIQKWVTDTKNGTNIYAYFVNYGQHFFYDIFVYNDSEKDWSITVTDTIDSKLTVVGASDDGEISGQKVTWSNLEVPVDGMHLYVEVTPASEKVTEGNTEIVNTATMTNDTTKGKITSNQVINFLLPAPTKSETLTAKAETSESANTASTSKNTVVSSSSVSSSKSNTKTAEVGTTSTTDMTVGAGDEVTYTITFKNTADRDKVFTITDTVDARLTVTKINDGGKMGWDRTITWKITVPANTEKSVTFVALAPLSENAETIDNKATVSVDGISKDTNVVTINVNPATAEQLTPANKIKDVINRATGDVANIPLWIGLAALAVAAIAGTVVLRKKRNR